MKKPYANDAKKIISDVFLNDVLAIMTSRKISCLLTLTWLRRVCEKPFEAPRNTVKRTTQHAFQMHGKSIHFNGISAILLHDFRLYHKALSVWWQFKCESAYGKRSNYKENRYEKRATKQPWAPYAVKLRCYTAMHNCLFKHRKRYISKNWEIANQQSFVRA